MAQSSAGLSVRCQGKGSGRERLVCGGHKGRTEVRGLDSWPGRGREKSCLPSAVQVPQGLRALGPKNEACGQETPGRLLALPLGK